MPSAFRHFAVLIGLLLFPLLCAAGLESHECACGPEGVTSSCSHETSCDEDPCANMRMAPSERLEVGALDFELWEGQPATIRLAGKGLRGPPVGAQADLGPPRDGPFRPGEGPMLN